MVVEYYLFLRASECSCFSRCRPPVPGTSQKPEMKMLLTPSLHSFSCSMRRTSVFFSLYYFFFDVNILDLASPSRRLLYHIRLTFYHTPSESKGLLFSAFQSPSPSSSTNTSTLSHSALLGGNTTFAFYSYSSIAFIDTSCSLLGCLLLLDLRRTRLLLLLHC